MLKSRITYTIGKSPKEMAKAFRPAETAQLAAGLEKSTALKLDGKEA